MWGRRRQLDLAFLAVKEVTAKHKFSLNGPVRTCLMHACLLNDDTDRALEIFEELKAHGFDADAKAYGTLISGIARLGKVEVAARLTEEAYDLVGPHALESGVLDQLCRSMSKANRVKDVGLPLFNKLRAKGVPVTSYIASMMHGGPSHSGGTGSVRGGGGGYRR